MAATDGATSSFPFFLCDLRLGIERRRVGGQVEGSGCHWADGLISQRGRRISVSEAE